MGLIEDLSNLSLDEIERIERLTTRWIFQAVRDFGMEAYEIFLHSPDDVKDVAEDVTREVLDRLQGFNIPQRVFGTVDYKKARYIILPDQAVRQALFIESKAEKESRSATIQMSQTSMHVHQVRGGKSISKKGFIPEVYTSAGVQFLTTTAVIHFRYEDVEGQHILQKATIACIPNGNLQDRYNPTVDDSIWLAGRNAPSLGEDFRVRLSFHRLQEKAPWRLQEITYDPEPGPFTATWRE